MQRGIEMAGQSTVAVDVERLAQILGAQLEAVGGKALRLDGDGEPSLLAIHPDVGLMAVDIEYSGVAIGDQAPFLRLNEKIHTLRQNLQLDSGVPIGRVVLHTQRQLDEPSIGIGGRTSISPAQLADSDWFTSLKAQPVDDVLVLRITELLEPAFTFTTVFRSSSHDEGAGDRENLRVTLDATQAAIAQRDDIDVALVQGPPGSGKTLVLAARARWLATRHPEWSIRFLCYNNALVPYLKTLVADYPNVVVTTMWPFAQEFRVRFSFEGDNENYEHLKMAKARGARPIADAVLLDEVQDFSASWLAIIHAGLVPGRGGLVMAGDQAQALYGVSEMPEVLKKLGVERISLERPYRCTRSILGAIGGIGDEFAVASLDQAPQGEPVELIWAESPAEQARAIAWEINLALSSGDRLPGDIAIIIPRYKGTITFIAPALEAMGIPFEAVVSKDAKKAFDRTTNTVKLITPHSAKGHEFLVVFLFGLDTMKPFDPTDRESIQTGRAGFVGATRAKDQLLITYTKHNSYLEILSKDETYVRRWLWPDQYDGAMNNG